MYSQIWLSYVELAIIAVADFLRARFSFIFASALFLAIGHRADE